jgi:hypothetical protein
LIELEDDLMRSTAVICLLIATTGCVPEDTTVSTPKPDQTSTTAFQTVLVRTPTSTTTTAMPDGDRNESVGVADEVTIVILDSGEDE